MFFKFRPAPARGARCNGAKPAGYSSEFATDLPRAQARFDRHARIWVAEPVSTVKAAALAWKKKSSWYMVAKGECGERGESGE